MHEHSLIVVPDLADVGPMLFVTNRHMCHLDVLSPQQTCIFPLSPPEGLMSDILTFHPITLPLEVCRLYFGTFLLETCVPPSSHPLGHCLDRRLEGSSALMTQTPSALRHSPLPDSNGVWLDPLSAFRTRGRQARSSFTF